MRRETWEKNQVSMDEIINEAEGIATELKEAEKAGKGLGGAALFAEKLEEQAAALRELSEKQRQEAEE